MFEQADPCACSSSIIAKFLNCIILYTRVRRQYLLIFNTTLTRFTMDNGKLIELVRTRTELYDLSRSKYSDSTRKENIWKGIAYELNRTGKRV